MNKTPIILVILAVIILGTAGYLVLVKGKGDTFPIEAGGKSLSDLMAENKTQMCTVFHTTDVTEASGVVYTDNGRIRADYTAVSAGQTNTVHLLVNNEAFYTWIDGVPVGMQMAAADFKNGQAGTAQDINQKLDYTCEPWTVDTALFSVPANITFTSLAN